MEITYSTGLQFGWQRRPSFKALIYRGTSPDFGLVIYPSEASFSRLDGAAAAPASNCSTAKRTLLRSSSLEPSSSPETGTCSNSGGKS